MINTMNECIDTHSSPMEGYSNEIHALITSIRLEEANRRLSDLLYSTTLPCLVFGEDGEIITFNKEIARAFGLPESSTDKEFAQAFRAIQPERQPDKKSTEEIRRGLIDEALANGFSQGMFWLKKADGAPICFMVTIARISWLSGYRLVVYYYDRTDIMTKEAHEKEAERQRKLMLDAAPLGCLMFNDDSSISECNYALLNMFGVPRKSMIIEDFSRFSPVCQPDGRLSKDKAEEYLEKAYKKGSVVFEWTHQNFKGETIPAQVKLARIKYGDKHGVVGYIRDLREKKASELEIQATTEREREARLQKEAAQASNEAKSRFLANMSHEIRTPMNSIIGFSELAMDDDVSPRTREYLTKIVENSTWLLDVINDILDLSKIESGKMELELAPFDLHNVFRRCQTVIHPCMAEKGLELKTRAEAPEGKNLLGDQVRLYQALLNLLSNAVKFTNSGAIRMSSTIKEQKGNKATIHFEVRDSGIGMTPEQIDRIFEPFVQADASTTRNYGGTGLGLSITKDMIELMGGKLEVVSKPGSGSVFCFELTFDTTDDTDGDSGGDEIGVVEKPHFDGMVLVCEDNAMNQQVITEHLARIGLRAVVAENGETGVEMVRERQKAGAEQFDLILMDMFMPVMDGAEAAKKITALGTGVPIVAMTANIMTGDLENYKDCGMPDYIAKPFTSQELWRCMLKYLKPVSVTTVSGDVETHDAELTEKLRMSFFGDNQKKHEEISEAIETGDLVLAHRLAHTLKTNAGLIGMAGLQKAAAEVEALLKDGERPVHESLMTHLKSELVSVLDELKRVFGGHNRRARYDSVTSKRAFDLFDKIAPMLEKLNPECGDMLDEIRAVPGAEELARQIEDYDYETAALTLTDLRKTWVLLYG